MDFSNLEYRMLAQKTVQPIGLSNNAKKNMRYLEYATGFKS